MKDLEKKLLNRVVDSILNGQETIETVQNPDGTQVTLRHKINDLRSEMASDIANKISNSDKFNEIIINKLDTIFIEKLKKKMLSITRFSDLPYSIQKSIEERIKECKMNIERYDIEVKLIKKTNQTKKQ